MQAEAPLVYRRSSLASRSVDRINNNLQNETIRLDPSCLAGKQPNLHHKCMQFAVILLNDQFVMGNLQKYTFSNVWLGIHLIEKAF